MLPFVNGPGVWKDDLMTISTNLEWKQFALEVNNPSTLSLQIDFESCKQTLRRRNNI